MSAREKIAYLKGLLDGLGPVENEGQGKIFRAVVDALDALSLEVAEHEDLIQEQRELYEDLADDCALLDEDLDSLEKAFSDFSGEGDMDDEDDEDEDDEFDRNYVSVTCPHCSYVFYYQPEEYEPDEALECPGCGKDFEQPKE
ncbi:MAG TPA: hypothetical protein PK849_11170 [Synergistales bacterium]|jgi:hypothetical protein|nr:hypothetical protein [Synergistaceae bacterium]NLD95899.1 hypothetical protein [Synergistaceae bacterium]HOO86264.1 hypothetical protein [Synergistales bacterium]HPE66728.1 hypothetical protein [Synergistales bacterium]HPR90075.1 hypothetical protein [Synergistaceae bacterium]